MYQQNSGALDELTIHNTLLDPTSPLVGPIKLKEAVSINSKGWIAANGSDTRDNLTQAFLLIPSH